MDLVLTLVIGGAAGWLTGVIRKGDGYGILMNIILGILGGLFGGCVIGLLGFNAGGGLIPQCYFISLDLQEGCKIGFGTLCESCGYEYPNLQ
jgi:uncharacterized membrane protein YeaQ/YmgE (transglycosylase-associated protein family)